MADMDPAESSCDDGRTGNGSTRISPQALDGIVISCQRCQNASPFSLDMQQCSKCHSFFANQKIPIDLGKEELLALVQGSTKRVFSVERQDLVWLLGSTEQQQKQQQVDRSFSGLSSGRLPLEPIKWAGLEDSMRSDDRIQDLSAPKVFRRPNSRGEVSWVLIEVLVELRKTLLEACGERGFFSVDLARGVNKLVLSSAPKKIPFGFTMARLGEQYTSSFLADQLPPGLQIATAKDGYKGTVFVNQSDKRGSFYSKDAKEESILLLLSSSDDIQIWLAPEGKGPVNWYGGGLEFSDAVFKPAGWQYCIKGPPKTLVVSLPVKLLSQKTNANKRKAPADRENQDTGSMTSAGMTSSESLHTDDTRSLASEEVPKTIHKRKRLHSPAKKVPNKPHNAATEAKSALLKMAMKAPPKSTIYEEELAVEKTKDTTPQTDDKKERCKEPIDTVTQTKKLSKATDTDESAVNKFMPDGSTYSYDLVVIKSENGAEKSSQVPSEQSVRAPKEINEPIDGRKDGAASPKKPKAAKSLLTVKKEKLHGRQLVSRRPRRAIHKCGFKPECNQGFESGLMWVLALDEENWDESQRNYPAVYSSIPEHLVCETCREGRQPPPVPDWLPEEVKKRYKYCRLSLIDYQKSRQKEPLFGHW